MRATVVEATSPGPSSNPEISWFELKKRKRREPFLMRPPPLIPVVLIYLAQITFFGITGSLERPDLLLVSAASLLLFGFLALLVYTLWSVRATRAPFGRVGLSADGIHWEYRMEMFRRSFPEMITWEQVQEIRVHLGVVETVAGERMPFYHWPPGARAALLRFAAGEEE